MLNILTSHSQILSVIPNCDVYTIAYNIPIDLLYIKWIFSATI